MKKLNGITTLDNITLGSNTQLDKNIIYPFAKASLISQASQLTDGNTFIFGAGIINSENTDLYPYPTAGTIKNISNRNIEVVAFGKANIVSGTGNVVNFNIYQNNLPFAFPINYFSRTAAPSTQGSFIHGFTSLAPNDTLSMYLSTGTCTTDSNSQLIVYETPYVNFANNFSLIV